MKDCVGECGCLGYDSARGAADRISLVVRSEGPSSSLRVVAAAEPQTRTPPTSLSGWHRLGPRARRAMQAWRPSSIAPAGPAGQPSKAGQVVTALQTPRLVGRPFAAPSKPGPESAARGVGCKLPVQLRAPPPPPPIQARSRRREA